MKQTFYYKDPKDYNYNEMVDVNGRKETLIYEGNKQELLKELDAIVESKEYNIISTKNFSSIQDVKRFNAILAKINPNPDYMVQPFSSLDYTIFKEAMIDSGSAEMNIYLEEKIYKLKFLIARSVEYDSESTEIGFLDKRLYFIVDIVDQRIDNVPNNTVIYIKKYAYKTLK